MSFLGIKVPHEIARLLTQVDYGGHGKPEPTEHFHVTVAYFGEDIPIERIAKIITSTYAVTSSTKPFTVQTSRVTTFPAHPEKGTVPVICRIESTGLHELRKALLRQFDTDGVEFDTKFPRYQPHVTLAYTSPGDGAEEVKDLDLTIPTIEWGVGEVILWGGDSGDDRLVTTFPFALAPTMKAALYRALVRVAQYHPRNALRRG